MPSVQAFTPAALVEYAPSLTNTVETTLEEWANQGTFKGWTGCRALAFDVAAVVLLGRRMEGRRMGGCFTAVLPVVSL